MTEFTFPNKTYIKAQTVRTGRKNDFYYSKIKVIS